MLVATFNDSTAWSGRTITHDGQWFILEGFGPIAAAQVLSYADAGQLTWASDGMRSWVGAVARMTPTPIAGSERPGMATRRDTRSAARRTASMAGIAVLVIGLLMVAYLFLFFDVTVPTALGRVNNIGLMAERQNGILVGLGLIAGGGVLMYIGRLRP